MYSNRYGFLGRNGGLFRRVPVILGMVSIDMVVAMASAVITLCRNVAYHSIVLIRLKIQLKMVTHVAEMHKMQYYKRNLNLYLN